MKDAICSLACLPNGHSIYSLAASTLPGSRQARLSLITPDIPLASSLMEQAIAAFAHSLSLDPLSVQRDFIYAQYAVHLAVDECLVL